MSEKTILVTGGFGLVGRAIQKVIKDECPTNEEWVFLSSENVNLLDIKSTNDVFNKYKPTHVIHLAATVGGLYGHHKRNLEMMRTNLCINDNVFEATVKLKCKRIVSCMSTCIFPDKIAYPLDETMIHNGPPHKSNAGYAYAKRLLDVSNHIYSEEFVTHCTGIIPTNVYGPNDNFGLHDSHVLPGLIHKCYLAQKEKSKFVVSGTGTSLRQFIFSEDLAKLVVWALRDYPEVDPIILSVPEEDEISVKQLAQIIAEAFNYKEDIIFDTSKSDGQYKKTASNEKMRKYLPGFKFKPLREGIQETVDWFKANYPNVRTSYSNKIITK